MKRGLHSIHTRLFLLFLFCMLGLLLIVSALYYKRTTDQLHQKIGEIAQKNFSQTMDLFDLLLKGYDSLTKSLNGNPDLQRLLQAPPTQDSALRMINERTITNLIGAIYYSREDTIGIHVVANSGTIYSYGNSMSVIDPGFANSSWYRSIRESSGEMVWLGVKEHSIIDQAEKRPVFAFGRPLYDLHEHRPIGIVLIETDPKPILSGLANLSLSPRSEVYILSKAKQVMAVSAQTPKELSVADYWSDALGEGEVRVDPQAGRLIVASKPSMADWQVVSSTPDTDLNVEQDQMKRFLLLVISVLVVVSTALATFVSRTISSPLKRLIQQMKQVERGNFRGLLHVKSYEEINILVASFNQMVNRMDELIERVKAVSISEKNAQLLALQSQVNPHFLYNTLDMIYWMLDEKGNERLGKVVLSLSHMFRYSSHWEGSSEVWLRDELEQIRDYLTIIEARLEGRVSVEMDVDPAWEHIRLPKMTLQPAIENAVKHGLERLDRPGVLRVYAKADDRQLRLYVEDNGSGMEPHVLDRLRRSLGTNAVPMGEEEAGRAMAVKDGETRRGGIGLQNVHRRLGLMFGEAYGLRIDSSPGAGTTVTISMPLPGEGGTQA
ncbi:cache domain-containing sensor histidine kinase [Paenibacillus tyrfis]|uniref:cache domain-containing sensor histidine kinase n=1 Tax=Paenibacillus tyrfis TaxID=1501230 RepID=UPI0020A1A279|nr:sensor histidine kinase [Paenibacillus tyrfis]MCP1309641.1 sensor histidine kinase [Paenibacillus tyrfis]